MRIRVLFLATLLATLAPIAGVRAAEDEATVDVRQAHLFPRPAELEPQIRFWRAIFTQYSAHQVVLHDAVHLDRKSTRLNSSHMSISYAVFCLKKKKK